jgi:uncharacterized oxidoreductase
MRMTGNTILITGGTSGIGRGLAEAFHDRSNRVIITGRRKALLDEVSDARPDIVGFELDIDKPASLARLSDDVQAQFPDLNVLIANAGISLAENVAGADWAISDAEALIDTNITGTLRTIAAFLPMLKRREDSVVLATSSKLAFVPLAAFPTYCATKAFMHSWLQSFRHQLRNMPIEVLELLPPYVATKLTGDQQISDPRAMPLDAFITEVMQLLEAGDHVNGEILVERARADRAAEREGRYDAAFSLVNPQ